MPTTYPTASQCVTHWLSKLPGELCDEIIRETYELLFVDLERRACFGRYSIKASSTALLCKRTQDAFSETGSEARSIWLAEFWPRICKLYFRFTSIEDYLTYHLGFQLANLALYSDTEIVLQSSSPLPGGFTGWSSGCRKPTCLARFHDRNCSICHLLDMIARGCGVLEHLAMGCQPECEKDMWWQCNSAHCMFWLMKLKRGMMPESQSFVIGERTFVVDHLAFDRNGHTEHMRIKGPLHKLDWQRYLSHTYSDKFGQIERYDYHQHDKMHLARQGRTVIDGKGHNW
ncbi:hypothetical protein LTR17_016000 [Elasticomyces elasticus]|nr:hypothetical protein LTR17_016000 [Elasticomyces elasticus]